MGAVRSRTNSRERDGAPSSPTIVFGETAPLIDLERPAARDNGSGAATISLAIQGMTCSACSDSISNALLARDGVLQASVSLLQNKAAVTFDPSKCTVNGLIQPFSQPTPHWLCDSG